jgi:hypothetical protein
MAFWAAAIPAAMNLLDGASKKAPVQQVSSPVDRRMGNISSDPNNVLKQGRSALDQADAQTRESLAPVLDEAIKKSAQQKQQNQGY